MIPSLEPSLEFGLAGCLRILDVPGQWQCGFCGGPTRNQCYKCGQPRSAGSCSPRGSTYLDPQGMVGGLPQCFLGSSPLNPGMVHGPSGRGPPPKRSQTPPTSRRGPTVSPKPPPGAGTGYVRFDERPLVPPPAPMSSQPVNQVLPLGSPSGCGAPLPVGPVVDSVADQLRALEFLSSFMGLPEIETLRSRLVPPPTPVPSEPVLTSHRALAQELEDKCKRQEKLQTQLSEQWAKVAEEERVLERVQADLVGLVGEVSDLDEEILELRRKVSEVPEPEDMDDSDGSTPRVCYAQKA